MLCQSADPKSLHLFDQVPLYAQRLFKPDVNVDATKYETRQVFYPSKDGTVITMFTVAKKGVKLDGNNLTLLCSHGGSDYTITPSFKSNAALCRPAWGSFPFVDVPLYTAGSGALGFFSVGSFL